MDTGAQILVVDDEPQIRHSLQVGLTGKGYQVTVAESGEQALQSVCNRIPDVMVVDLLLPGIDGIELTRQVRETSAVPIIFLSCIGEEQKKVEALEVGADDYVTKPFGMDELMARIGSLMRRASGGQDLGPVFICGELSVNFERREVKVGGNPVKLTPTEYDLLKYMIQNRRKVLTHRMVLSAIWGKGYEDQAQYLRVFVGQLRKKIESTPGRPRYILTDPGVGYRFSEN